ncbi:MAG: MalY/PatB family protein [Eubacteriales bacterium]|nr:MalY/PatB family protein [Eubacteriales bacterium]
MFDFDTTIERRGTDCLKYDFARERGMPEDVLPLWVADMDFATAPVILEKLEQRVRHGIFGYSEGKEGYFRALESWYERRFDWKVKRSWLVKTPGVVFALATAVRAYTEAGDAVLIQQPVYYPFSEVILDNGRRLVNSPLKIVEGRYEMDFEDFEAKIVEEKVKLFLLCSPHNPAGRVWKEWELRKVGEICQKHGVLVVSDEIHSDFVWPGNHHLVFASLSPEHEKMTVTCTSPSKTFNVAGLQISNIFIPDPELRRRFREKMASAGYSQPNVMGLAACQAAYEGGEQWLEELKGYIWDNYLFLKDYLEKNIPKVQVFPLEGTYLVWVDFRQTGLTEKERQDLIVNKAHLWLDSGAMFGEDGEGFERINIACPRATLERALRQLEEAL